MEDIKKKSIGDIIYNRTVMYAYILLFPFFEIVTTFMLKQMNMDISFGMIYKTMFIIYALGYIIFYSKANKKINIIYLIIIGTFTILNIIFTTGFTLNLINIEKVTDITKYFCYPIYIIFFTTYFKDNNNFNEKILVYTISIFAATMIIAGVTETAYTTYSSSIIYGQKGWFYSGNEISSIFAMLLPITIYYAVRKNDVKIWICLLLSIYGALSIGTKVSFVAIIIAILTLGLFGLIKFILNKKDHIAKRLIITVCIIAVGIYLYAPYSASIKVMTAKYNMAKGNVSEEVKKGKISKTEQAKILEEFIMSGREIFLEETIELYKEAKIENKLFGIREFPELEGSNRSKIVERDFYDILFRYGIIGFIIFFIPTVILITTAMKKIIKNIKEELDYFKFASIISVSLAFGVAYIAGHVLLAPSVAIFLSIILTNIEGKKEKEIGS